jgi:type IV secretory pathway VirJ component
MSLLGLSASADFEIKVAGWLPGADNSDLATLPELQRITSLPLLCAYGSGEADSICPTLRLPNASSVMIGSGHHFGGQTAAITEAILRVADSRLHQGGDSPLMPQAMPASP